MPKDYSSIKERQSYVQKSGEDWGNFVMEFTNKILKNLNSNIHIIKGKAIPKGASLWTQLAIPVGKIGSTQRIWGDIDLVAINWERKPIAVISCKTSLHGRLSETLFYALVLKDLNKNLKVLFATPDKGRQQKGEEWSSEWGSENKPTKDRLLGTHYLDGVYIHNQKTKLGGSVKDLSELARDLITLGKSLTH